ncbi:MAG: acyltransferase [Prevotella sp.]|nr:acyltransferase [Prevotella sp.]
MAYDDGIIHFGANALINSCCNFGCQKKIVIGDNAVFAAGSCVYDTNFHYLYNFKTRSVKDICSPVRIGDNVWIGTNCYISKGITIPSGCTLAANAVISRPFNDEISENSIIAGHPAKVISTGYTMIRGSMEWELMQHFKNTSEKEIKIDYS